jgi:effector-binding domain-containing protein
MEDTMSDCENYEIVLKTVESLHVAARRVFIPTNDEVPELLPPAFDEVARYIHLHGVRASGPCLAVWYSSAEALENEEVEAAFPIGAPLPETERIRVYDLPQEYVASVVHKGDFDEFGQAYKAILRWIETNGYRITGPYREIYLQHDRRDLKDTTTEIQFPIEMPS